MPILYLVATPIGNLEDITLRALRILGEVGLVAAEDTRKTRRLFARYDIKTPLTSYHEYSTEAVLQHILDKLKDMDVALVSEAGMPGISDPGYALVVAAIQRGIPVVPIPGPSVVLAALAVSGLSTNRFLYLGFLPRRPSDRRQTLQSVAKEPGTILAFESPHRLRAALSDIFATLGDRRMAVCREMTKMHEEVFRGVVSAVLERFSAPRGEFTLVIEGAGEQPASPTSNDVRTRLRQLQASGLPAREAVSRIAREFGLPHREVYRMWLEAKAG
ncbi:MAG: 16S rRNA (cytidine(1402)-2'-O)-methyltransferase [Chloroflexi bacterium]|nr:16S rRNA (cytidine(1402)-2'-O)-methyltransferase [Chloroflexota bacterium]